MALWPYSPRTVDQAKEILGLEGSQRDVLVEAIVNHAARLLENAWGRHVVSRGSLTEFHVADPSRCLGHELWLNEWPIVSVTTVHEDANRAFGATTLLVVNTDYVVSKPMRLIRTLSSLRTPWLTAWRGIKVVYIAGYLNVVGTPIAGAEEVPGDVLGVFDDLVRDIWAWQASGRSGLTTVNDATGTRSFIGAPGITPGYRSRLIQAGALPASLAGRTGERDS